MLRRRTPQVLIGTAIIGLGATVLAAPAQAETTVTVTGNFTNFGTYFFSSSAYAGVDPESVQDSTVTVVADITWVVTPPQLYVVNEALSNGGTDCLSDACPISVGTEGATFDVATWANNRSVLVTTFAGSEGAEKRLKIDNDSYRGGALSDVFFLLTYEAPPTPDPSPSDSTVSTATPAPLIQQFGVPESGTCDEAAGADHNWAGVASGGWGESWAQWANGGAGGAVCSRTLIYNASQGAWAVD